MPTHLPAWPRLLLTLALLLPTVLPAFVPAPAASTSASALSSIATFTSPLPPPTPAPSSAAHLALTLAADPVWTEPGEVVTFTVTAANIGSAPLAGLTLTDALPDGLIYVAQSAVGFAYAASQQQLTWQPAAVAAGATITGSFQARVQGLAMGATVTNTVTAAAPGLAAPVNARAVVDVVSPRNNEVWVTPGQGGLLRSTDDRALLRVPPAAVAGRTRFTYAPVADPPNPPPGLRFAFRLEAQDERGQAVREFPTALDLEVAYRDQADAALGLAYYDEASQRWLPIAAEMKHGRRQLRASLGHLTLFAGTTTSGPYDLAPASSIRGAQPQLYSRSIAYTYPFDLPSGRGGLTPRLALTYSSANHSQQAGHFSLVGHGWNLLGADYVERNPHTHEVTLVLQGRTYTLAHSEPNSHLDNFHLGSWAVKEAPGWRVTYEASDGPSYKYRVFHVWASDGVHYQFQGNLHVSRYTSPPTAGLLKRVETLSVFNGAYQGNPASISQYYDYENGNLKWSRDANNNQTTYFYDSWYKAFRVCEQNAAQQKIKTTYYGVPGDGACNTTSGSALGTAGAVFGQVEQVEDANGVKNRTACDGLGRVQTVTLAVGTADQALRSYSYRPFAGIGLNTPFWVHAQQQDNAGGDGYQHTWTFYDGFGRAIETQAEADNNQHIETYRSYTFRDAPERESPPLLQPGSVTSSASYTPIPTGAWPNQIHTRYEYDALGRPTKVTYPDNTTQTTSYTAEGRSTGVRSITAATDERGRQRKTEQDAFGRLRNSTIYTLSGVAGYPDNTPISASYAYNVADQLTTVTAPGGFVTAIGYDGLGRKRSVSDPDLGAWGYTYDNAGNLQTQTDARGVTLWFGYDNLNRLTEKRQTAATGPLLAQYFYDEAQAGYSNLGRRTRATAYEYRDGWGGSATLSNSLAQSYDARGRVKAATRTVDGVSYTTQYAYDAADRVTRIIYPDGEQATTAYGSQGQPISLTSSQVGILADSASYDEANRLRSLRFPAGGNLVQRQVYYPWTQQRGRLQNLLVGTGATTADRLNLIYTYDAVGNVSSISDNGIQSSFSYDGLYQLRSAYGQSFAYDTAGRLTSFNGLAYAPDSAHPHAVDRVNGADRYDYDANGNQVVRNKGVVNQEQVLTWDAENRLAAVTYTNRTPSGGGGGGLPAACNGVPCKRIFLPLVMQQTPAERYSYDADGGRVRKETQTEITRYIGPHFEVTIAITNSQVLTTTKYYDFGGQRIAVRQIAGTNQTLSYLHGDHLGSTSVATSNTGAATSNVRYFAYGGQRSGNLFALPTDHAFTGQKLDRGTGLLYYGARYYDSALGTFLSPDTIVPEPGNPQDLNRYSYVRNNPLRYTDPTGHWVESAFDVISLGMTVNDIRKEGLTFWNVVSLVTDMASVALPIVPAGASHVIRASKLASRALNAADAVADTSKLLNVADTAKFINRADNAGDAIKPLRNLPDNELLYQFSRAPDPNTGAYKGFPDTLRTKQGEQGMSCQIASLCGHDPVQGFRQQFPDRVGGPGPGDWVREATVGAVKQWGGRVDPDYLRDPKLPYGHATIYSSGGKWGKPFDRIWRNKRPLFE